MELKSIKKLSLTVNTVILIMVFGLMFFFHLCNVTFLVYFSIPTSMIYVIGYCLIHKNKLNIYVWLVFFWLTFYMGVTTICLGYDYGFHLYCFSMIPSVHLFRIIGSVLRPWCSSSSFAYSCMSSWNIMLFSAVILVNISFFIFSP